MRRLRPASTMDRKSAPPLQQAKETVMQKILLTALLVMTLGISACMIRPHQDGREGSDSRHEPQRDGPDTRYEPRRGDSDNRHEQRHGDDDRRDQERDGRN